MSNYDKLFSTPITNLGNWIFDEKVAKVFPNMIYRSIPGYSSIMLMIGMLTERFAQPGTQFYDLGCAVGMVTLLMQRHIHYDNCKIIAVDNSPAMVKQCRQHIKAHETSIPIELIEDDICNIAIENASMVVLNFTMQFLSLDCRQSLINKIYQGLNSGGILVLSEKFSFEDKKIDKLLFNMHYDFKRANGYSELEINQKFNMLKNVMLIDSVETHKVRLKKAGFNHIDLCFQCFNFGSLMALK